MPGDFQINVLLTLFRMDLFGAAHGWGGFKICHTYTTHILSLSWQKKNLTSKWWKGKKTIYKKMENNSAKFVNI